VCDGFTADFFFLDFYHNPLILICSYETASAKLARCYCIFNIVADPALFWWRNPRERDHWGDPDLDGRIILRWIFRKLYVGYGID
jgi:hypothetical protein